MPFSDYAADNFISQELSQLTKCNAPEISSRFSQHEYWLANFVLNSIFGHRVGEEGRKFAYVFLRRAEAAFLHYEHARQALLEFSLSVEAGNRRLIPYFQALHFFEATLAMLWQSFALFKRISGKKLYEKGDGSTYETLNFLYNISRHTDPQALPARHLHAVWLSNDGLEMAGYSLSFTALENLMVEIGELADLISSCTWHKESGNESDDTSTTQSED